MKTFLLLSIFAFAAVMAFVSLDAAQTAALNPRRAVDFYEFTTVGYLMSALLLVSGVGLILELKR